MAASDAWNVFDNQTLGMSKKGQSMLAFEEAVAAYAGTWISAKNLDRLSLHLVNIVGVGSLTLAIELRGHNGNAKPADSDDGYLIGTQMTALGVQNYNNLCTRWIKVKRVTVTPTGGAKLNGYVHALSI